MFEVEKSTEKELKRGRWRKLSKQKWIYLRKRFFLLGLFHPLSLFGLTAKEYAYKIDENGQEENALCFPYEPFSTLF